MNQHLIRWMLTLVLAASVVLMTVGVGTADVIDVPFKAQVPPGTWSESKNCGQASSLMVFSYYNGNIPTEQGIKDIDDWLYGKYGDPVDNYNGSYTTTTKLEKLAQEYAGFPDSYKASGWTLNRLKQEIDAGNPVVVAVVANHLSNRNYDWSGGHFVVANGYNDTHIICNDPGTSNGNSKYYLNNEFLAAMNAESGSVVVIIPTKPSILDQSISPTIVAHGNELTFVYNIDNPYPDNIENVRLGAQIRTNDPQGDWIDDPANDAVVTLLPGAHDYWY